MDQDSSSHARRQNPGKENHGWARVVLVEPGNPKPQPRTQSLNPQKPNLRCLWLVLIVGPCCQADDIFDLHLLSFEAPLKP